jgi:hypothetical protein
VKTSLRHLVAICALLILAPVLTACGFGAQTNQVYQPAIGTDARGESTDALGVVIVSGEDGSGQLIFSLNNNSFKDADKLVKVSGTDLEIAPTEVDIPAQTLLNLSDKPIAVTGDAIKSGDFVKLVFEFQSGEVLNVMTPIVTTQPPYNDIAPESGATESPAGDEEATN